MLFRRAPGYKGAGGDHVSLALVERKRLLAQWPALLETTRKLVDLGQVNERVRVPVEHVGFLGEIDRLAGEPLCLGELAPPGGDLRGHLPPEHARGDVVSRGERLGRLGPLLRLVEAAERVERRGQLP